MAGKVLFQHFGHTAEKMVLNGDCFTHLNSLSFTRNLGPNLIIVFNSVKYVFLKSMDWELVPMAIDTTVE
jgi:hypothetical protein